MSRWLSRLITVSTDTRCAAVWYNFVWVVDLVTDGTLVWDRWSTAFPFPSERDTHVGGLVLGICRRCVVFVIFLEIGAEGVNAMRISS